MRVDTHEERTITVHITTEELHKMLCESLQDRGVTIPRAADFKTLALVETTGGYTLHGVIPPADCTVERLVF